jgi:hypothetical protein
VPKVTRTTVLVQNARRQYFNPSPQAGICFGFFLMLDLGLNHFDSLPESFRRCAQGIKFIFTEFRCQDFIRFLRRFTGFIRAITALAKPSSGEIWFGGKRIDRLELLTPQAVRDWLPVRIVWSKNRLSQIRLPLVRRPFRFSTFPRLPVQRREARRTLLRPSSAFQRQYRTCGIWASRHIVLFAVDFLH